jgi:hypothetical protein
MLREINYSGDIIEINTTTNTIKSKQNKKYEIITSQESGDIQFLIPNDDKFTMINAETGETSKIANEDEIMF